MSRLKYSHLFSLLALAFAPLANADIFDELASDNSNSQTDVDSAFAAILGDLDESTTKPASMENNLEKPKAKVAKEDNLSSAVVDFEKLSTSTKKKEISVSESDSYYLKNIPTNSMLVFKDEVTLLPRENRVHYKDGKRVYAISTTKPEPATYCTVMLNESGVGRRIKTGNQYPIADVMAKTERFDVEGVGSMYKREVIFELDHKHLKRVYCMSNEKPSELDLGDLKELSGGSLEVRLRELLDI
ncbi:hypothetical protein [Vibrio sp. D431a]|uniref:hypothetical protein n=1 Tax=Vibrio sp. D431a TaxID=2837388 RepID=UPI002555BE81|nr:hypothetical protein [Vibrio sp. D431a]MDK9790603.1 hypothetical protein [Vibrio sp. D431a]